MSSIPTTNSRQRTWRDAFSTLRARLLLLILLVLLPALVLILYTAAEQSRLAAAAAKQESLQLAQLAASNQAQLVEGARQLLIALAQLPVMHGGTSDECNALFVRLHQQYTNYTNVFAVDAHGDTFCTGIPAAQPVNVARQQWFQRAMAVPGFSVADYAIGIVSKRPVVTFSYPVLDETGAIKLQVGVSLDLNWMSNFIQNTQLPPDSTVVAIDRNGTILYRYPDPADWIGKPFPNKELLAQVLAQGSGTYEGPGITGRQRLFGFSPLSKTSNGTYVLIGLSSDMAFAEVNRLLAQNLVSLSVLGLVTMLIAWIGVNQLMVRPTQSLLAGTQKLASGDLSTRIDSRLTQGTTELYKLSESFNGMVEVLERRQNDLATEIAERTRIEEDLRAVRAELEQRVIERTAQLAQTNDALKSEIIERERTEQEQRFLEQVSILLASSLDYETTLMQIAQLAVPRLADFCTISMVQEDGTIQRVAAAHRDPAISQQAQEKGTLYPLAPDTPHGSALVIRTGQPEVVSDVRDIADSLAQDTRLTQDARKAGIVSYMAVPLIARKRTIGAIVFTMADSGRRCTPEDLPVAEELARRAATAIDNARLYRQAQEAAQARDEFLSVAAHELKTPITSLRGFSQTLLRHLDKRGTIDPAVMRRALTVIDQQSVKLTTLVSQLLDLSRLEAGRLALECEMTDIARLTSDVVATIQRSTNLHNLQLQTLPRLRAFIDPIRIEQVLVNLLDNAVKYSPEGGQIIVELSLSDDQMLYLTVTDHGLGIEPAKRQHIFERFYQAHQEGYRGGMGLGLYVSRQIVELHNGQISAEFPPDGGTRMIVRLPAGEPAAPAPAEQGSGVKD